MNINRQGHSPRRAAQKRIKAACHELELALQNFEQDEDGLKRAEEEARKLKAIKLNLADIKRQLDDLSK